MIKNFYDIIAIRFGSTIFFGQEALDRLKVQKCYDQLISRSEFEFMSKLDLGEKWGMYAKEAPTLFKLDHDTPFDIRRPNP